MALALLSGFLLGSLRKHGRGKRTCVVCPFDGREDHPGQRHPSTHRTRWPCPSPVRGRGGIGHPPFGGDNGRTMTIAEFGLMAIRCPGASCPRRQVGCHGNPCCYTLRPPDLRGCRRCGEPRVGRHERDRAAQAGCDAMLDGLVPAAAVGAVNTIAFTTEGRIGQHGCWVPPSIVLPRRPA